MNKDSKNQKIMEPLRIQKWLRRSGVHFYCVTYGLAVLKSWSVSLVNYHKKDDLLVLFFKKQAVKFRLLQKNRRWSTILCLCRLKY